MTTEVQIIDRGGLVKLFGATIRAAQSHLPLSSAAAGPGGPCSPPAYRREHKEPSQELELHHNDKKAKTDDDSPRSQEHQSPPWNFKEQSGGCSADDREAEAAEEEEMDHEAIGETTDEIAKNKQEDDKASLAKKKPDKLLPCPRCDSMDTKFCYFNNYNVNQPRHFCRQCQRYWTAGGAVRPNMPIGAGRRKKSSRAGSGARCLQQDGGVVMVLDHSVTDHAAAAAATGDGDGSILSFGGGGGIGSPSSNCATSNHRQVSAMQASPVENFQVPPPQVPWPVNGVGNHPMYFYGGSPTMPAGNSVCGVNSNGFTPTPQPVHLCWTPTPGAPGGWQLFSVVPWGPHMPSYHPAAVPPPMISAPTATGKQSHSHDVDRHSFGSSVVEDRQSSSSLEASPRSIPATTKKRSSAIRQEEEAGACRSYQLVSDMSYHRTEEVSKVLHSNPAAMMRSLNFQEGV